jgi:hypothetical protein
LEALGEIVEYLGEPKGEEGICLEALLAGKKM